MGKDILISGFGGQGMIKLGKFLAEAALDKYKHISWFPSYGAEMRGGTAHCFVRISNQSISSPFVALPDIAVIFNQPSLEKFKNSFNKNTLVILNKDLVLTPSFFSKAALYPFSLNKIAFRCGNIKVANTVALGVILSLTGSFFRRQTVVSVLKNNFSDIKIQKQNLKALEEGEKLC